jgi:hypothetical protein
MKMANPDLGFKIWTAALSLFVTVMLFIFGKHSFWKSLLIAALAVGAIWMMYFVIGQVIRRAVSEELKRRSRESSGDQKNGSGKPPGPTGSR